MSNQKLLKLLETKDEEKIISYLQKNPNLQSGALISAAEWNNFELVQLFIEMGADVNYELISKSGIRLKRFICKIV